MATAVAHPGGLTGVPYGAVPLDDSYGYASAPAHQPLAPVVKRPVQPIVPAKPVREYTKILIFISLLVVNDVTR